MDRLAWTMRNSWDCVSAPCTHACTYLRCQRWPTVASRAHQGGLEAWGAPPSAAQASCGWRETAETACWLPLSRCVSGMPVGVPAGHPEPSWHHSHPLEGITQASVQPHPGFRPARGGQPTGRSPCSSLLLENMRAQVGMQPCCTAPQTQCCLEVGPLSRWLAPAVEQICSPALKPAAASSMARVARQVCHRSCTPKVTHLPALPINTTMGVA